MKVTVTTGTKTVYLRELDDSKTMNAVMSHMMQQTQGDEFVTVVSNNGNELTFHSASLDIEKLVRKVEGIVARTPSTAAVSPA